LRRRAEKLSVECIADVRCTLGEGPVWVEREQAVYWVDIVEQRVFRWSREHGVRSFEPGAHVCSLAPRVDGGFIGAGYDGFLAIDLEKGLTNLGNPEADLENNRFNDGKVDRSGRFWAGTMDRREKEASGSLYRLDPDLCWTRIDTGYRVTNGPAFSVDGRTMYHTDSAIQRVYAFDLDAAGSASARRLLVQFGDGDGYPDGMTLDAEGCLWIAFWDGWCVRRISPSGERLQELRLPVQRPTSCTFGGPGLDLLFITSARRDLSEDALAMQPNAGGLFMTVPGARGIAEPLFAG
jgi:sugar lactone lactonase YvrE